MSQKIREITGIPTREKAEEKARQGRVLRPDWTIEVIGASPPFTVRSTPPKAVGGDAKIAMELTMTTKPLLNIASASRTAVLGFLDFIAQYESNGNYNARFGAATNTNDPAFTSMSVKNVLAWQKGRKFSACGKYQIIRATLTNLLKTLKLNGSQIYDRDLQDKMGTQLLKQRGLDKFLAGKTERDDFALSVAREWAALPGVKPPFGEKSVYAGDGVNQALVNVKTYLAALDQLKASV